MRKTITYSTFTLASIIVALLFVTSKSYPQLGLAVVLYPALAFLALKIFPRKAKHHEVTVSVSPLPEVKEETIAHIVKPIEPDTTVKDIDKRAFLKLIGVAGVSVFLFSIFSKRGQLPFFGKMNGSDAVNLKNSKGKTIDPAQAQPLDGFQISEIDDGVVSYYGFINNTGAWFIMREDTETSSFRYAKGDSSFPNSWTSRTRIKYDYFYNL